MAHKVCPWWIGYLLASPIRRFFYDPASILGPYVREGMTVLEPGPGMGFFTLELARKVGKSGRVVAVDIQPKMIDALKRRASKAGLADRIDARMARPGSLSIPDLAGKVEFVIAFAVVHEMPDAAAFFREAAAAMEPEASLLLVEPAGHVKDEEFQAELAAASKAGLKVTERPQIRRSQTALLTR